MSKAKPILVAIPWLPGEGQGRELEYAVAGWRRHFKENFIIAVMGDGITGRIPEGCIPIESPRVPDRPGQYRQHLDYVSCLRKVREAFPESKGFVMVADDCYAVNDFDMTDILFLKQLASDIDYDPDSPNAWRRDAMKTRALLVANGYPTRNFTTHLPQYYEWDKLAALWELFDMVNESYVMEDLYYNIYFQNRVPMTLSLEYDNLKCGVYEQCFNFGFVNGAFKSKIWINNSPNGWSYHLERALERYYFGI